VTGVKYLSMKRGLAALLYLKPLFSVILGLDPRTHGKQQEYIRNFLSFTLGQTLNAP
jgi:hypothetical protein